MDYFSAVTSATLRHTPNTVVILLAAYLAVLVIGLVGNVFVVLIVTKSAKMKSATNYFIVNLAVADLLVLIFCLFPGLVSNIYVPWVMGSLMCKAVPYIQGVAVCASVYSLVAISGAKLMAIRFPLRRQVSTSVARRIIIVIWIMSAGLALPWLLYFDLSNADRDNPSLVFCVESWPSGMNGSLYFALVNLRLLYLFPLSLIFLCHLSIWLRVRHRDVPTDSSVSQMKLVHQRTKARVQKIVIMIVAGFAACWLPLYAIFIRIKLVPVVLGVKEEEVLDYAVPIAQWMGALNSCLNPILYLFFNRKFRCVVQRLFRESSNSKVSTNFPTSHPHNHLNEGSECQRNLARLSVELHRYYMKQSRLSLSNAIYPKGPKWVTLLQENPKLATIA